MIASLLARLAQIDLAGGPSENNNKIAYRRKDHKMKRIPMIILMVMLVVLSASPISVRAADSFMAILVGANEVPPRDTDARGVATLKFNKEATELSFTLVVSNIENVVFAHIHCNVAGVNGPIGATLVHTMPAGGGTFNGLLAQETITAPDAGNACGWQTVADILTAIESGGAYVNVHTNDGVAPPNTGPGDFPGGEIRGQIR